MRNSKGLKLIQRVIKNLQEGDRAKAKKAAQLLADNYPEILEGWLFMTSLSDNIEDRLKYLSKAEQIAPGDPRLVKALTWANDQDRNIPSETALLTIKDKMVESTPFNHVPPSQPNAKQQRKLTSRGSWLTWLNLIISIILGAIGIGVIVLLLIQYGPRKPQTILSEDTLDRFQTTQEFLPTDTPTPSSSPTQITPIQTIESSHTSLPTASPTPTYTPTPEWMTYDGINFRDQEIEVLITMNCDQDQVYMDSFLVTPYTPELLDSGVFNANLDFSIAWEHLGFYGLWIHSGQSNQLGDLPAYPLQLYLENNAQGFRRNQAELFDHLQNCLIGSELRLRQGNTISVNRVVAAVRIPPPEVEEVSLQPMNLVPYLAENYPDSGFDQMELPGLLFFFCGRNTSGEAFNTQLNYWTQSRFIIGFMPVDEG